MSPVDLNPADSTLAQVSAVAEAAGRAAPKYAAVASEDRARFLGRIAERLEELGDELLHTANRETSLPLARLTGERGRACAQLRMFADLIRTDSWRDIRIEAGEPGRTPLPKPDLRRTQVPLGPVAVFGASNFPFAFSVPGGDTASALAAGCPVVVKAHPAHPETSRLAYEALSGAARDCGMPEGTIGIVWGDSEAGRSLVLDPNVYAVGFTGSHRAGRALFDLASGRERPIPVFAEMGSVNPFFVFPGALEARAETLAKGFSDSLTLGVGQFCTNPGVVVALAGAAFDGFLSSVAGHLQGVVSGTMLHPGIHSAYVAGVQERVAHAAVETCWVGEGAAPALLSVEAEAFLAHPSLREELFGPAAISVRCRDLAEMVAVADVLEGQLTATLHFESGDAEAVRTLMPSLVRGAGRLVANGYPTGVEVNSAMHHGGPYPATTDSRATSVGTAAILRFVRPVAFQDFPAEFLPPELQG